MSRRFPTPLLVFAVALVAATGAITGATSAAHGATQPAQQPAGQPQSPATVAPAKYVTLLFGRAQYATVDSTCAEAPGVVNLAEVARRFSTLDPADVPVPVVGVVNVVTDLADGNADLTRRCMGLQSRAANVTYANWSDLEALHQTYGWEAVSASKTYRPMKDLDLQTAQTESCATLDTFASHGFDRAFGLFAYPKNIVNGMLSDGSATIHDAVVKQCFAYGRRYGIATNAHGKPGRSDWMQSTASLHGGAALPASGVCATTSCYSPPTGAGSLSNQLDDMEAMTTGAWFVLQAYRFREGSGTGFNCGDGAHFTSSPEEYCWQDYATILTHLRPDMKVVDPAEVACAWGRGDPGGRYQCPVPGAAQRARS